MSASNAGPGGVRNLRAMFETKATDQSNSPPSRGRSPNGSVTSTHERPLSKVRASFVAVEQAGQETQTYPVLEEESSTMDGMNEHAVVDDHSLGQILKGSPFLDEGHFPDQPKRPSQSNGVADRAAAMVKKMQQNNPKGPPVGDFVDTSGGPKVTKPGPPRIAHKAPTEAVKSPVGTVKSPTTKGPIVKPKGGVAKIQGIIESAAKAKEGRAAAANETNLKDDTGKPQPHVDTTSKAKESRVSTAHEMKQKPTAPKTPVLPESTTRAKDARIPSRSDPPNKTPTPKETIKSPSTSRLPRASLPARRLPAAATAPTASSVAKVEDSKATDTKAVEKKTPKVASRVTNSTTVSSLAKKSSRASLNPSEGRGRTATKPADDSFLARMTRPTASSAQKAHDKVQPHSPPRSRQVSGKTLSAKPSRKSLNQADENKENETQEPPVPAIPQDAAQKAAPTEPQPAEV